MRQGDCSGMTIQQVQVLTERQVGLFIFKTEGEGGFPRGKDTYENRN